MRYGVGYMTQQMWDLAGFFPPLDEAGAYVRRHMPGEMHPYNILANAHMYTGGGGAGGGGTDAAEEPVAEETEASPLEMEVGSLPPPEAPAVEAGADYVTGWL